MCHRSVAVCLEVGKCHNQWLLTHPAAVTHSTAGRDPSRISGPCSSPCPPRTCADLAICQQCANCTGVAPLSAAGRFGHHRQLHLLWGQRGGGSGQARLLTSPMACRWRDRSRQQQQVCGRRTGRSSASSGMCSRCSMAHNAGGLALQPLLLSHSRSPSGCRQAACSPDWCCPSPAHTAAWLGRGTASQLHEPVLETGSQFRRAVPSSSQHVRSAGQQRGDGTQPLPLTASQVDHREALRQRGVQQQEG